MLLKLRFGVSLALSFRRIDLTIVAFHARKDCPELVILFLGDGINFVIVTTCAVDGDAHGGSDDLRDHVIQITRPRRPSQHLTLRFHLAHKIPRSGSQKSRGDHRLWIIGRDDIARDLFPQKLIVGLVGIQRSNDVIAITPGMGTQLVALETMRVRIVRNVQPMARPTFAIMLGGKQTVHQSIISQGAFGRLADKGLHFLRRWRKPREIKRESANEGARIGCGRELQTLRTKFFQNEFINAAACLLGCNRLHRPMLPSRII